MRVALKTFCPPRGAPPKTPEEGWCVRQIKRALNDLGYYTPPENAGITDDNDDAFQDSLTAFRRAQMIPFDDRAGPGSVTERILNEELENLDPNALYIWRTVGDRKVRDEHAARDGQRFYWSAPPDGEHPSEDYNCRCWAEPLNPSRHVWAEWTRKRQAKIHETSISPGAMGMPVPEETLPPEWQEVSAVELLWGGARITVAACWSNKTCRAWMIREGVEIVLENSHHLPPKDLPAFPDAKPAQRKGEKKRKRWIGIDGKIYEWDYKKGEVEIYDKTGKKHLGGFDPKTGRQRSKPVPGRKVEK